jgi:hypothetical protein
MRYPSRWQLAAGIGLLAGALVVSAPGFAVPALAQTGPVTAAPATGTPELVYGKTAPFEEVNVVKQCGANIYAGGEFTAITQNGTSYTRDNLFSFLATAPYTLTSWAPDVNGEVHTLAFDGGNCTNIYIGGDFTEIGGTAASDIASVNTTTGAVNTAFADDANGEVDAMAVSGSHLMTGGAFTSINGSSADPYFASLNIDTGLNDGYISLHISGNYSYPGVAENGTRVWDMQVSHAGARVMVEGDFTSVGGQSRQQVFQLWLSPNGAAVTAWSAPVLNTHCWVGEPFYAREVAWAPSDNEVYVATTGNHVYNWDNQFPMPQPCDMALAFSANESAQSTTWANPTGCDSLLSVVADNYAVYFAGHERWTDNPDGCNDPGPGAVQDYGMQGLNPSTGALLLNPSGQPLYTMARADGVNMILTTGGLWIASTNRFGTNTCQGVPNLSGLCYLPYPVS